MLSKSHAKSDGKGEPKAGRREKSAAAADHETPRGSFDDLPSERSSGASAAHDSSASDKRRSKRDPAVGIVVITHEGAADCLVGAARAIAGKLPGLSPVALKTSESQEKMIDRISAACDEVDEGAGVLLLVDVHGSTPFSAAMAMLDGTRAAEVVCGVNLPMLLKLTTVDRTQTPPAILGEILRDCGRRAIRLGSELTGRVSTTGGDCK